MSSTCDICFRRCRLSEGQIGFCKARRCVDGKVKPINYGKLTSIALDPIEKKPLYHLYPGSMVVSVGSYGCNLACPFCQNHEISLSEYRSADEGAIPVLPVKNITPEQLADICEQYVDYGNIGVAYTYNEPTVCAEYIIDSAKLIKERGLKTVLVTNGSATLETLEKLIPHIDAMNIDLKSFDEKYYRTVLHGDLETTKQFIRRAVADCHVEVTTLIVPGDNDTEAEIEQISEFLAEVGSSVGKDIPFHISRFFPRSNYSDRRSTDIDTVYRLADVARKKLKYVYEGNV